MGALLLLRSKSSKIIEYKPKIPDVSTIHLVIFENEQIVKNWHYVIRTVIEIKYNFGLAWQLTI
jgi:hypothetical protein